MELLLQELKEMGKPIHDQKVAANQSWITHQDL
jgi:hypothetical protein